MNIKEIKLLIDNDPSNLTKGHLDVLFKKIDDANVLFKRIALVSNSNKNHGDFDIINNLAKMFIEE